MDIENMEYNPEIEEIVKLLMNKTQNFSPQFFRLQANFYFTLVASIMNIKIDSPITSKIPINLYGINLANSGSGKGFSTNILENQVLDLFRQYFMNDILPNKAELSLEIEASRRTSSSGKSTDELLDELKKEYRSYGAYKFSFDSATSPAIKQLRNKLLLAKVGSLNLIMDEIGYNLSSNADALVTYLELYDKGFIKDKLVKNTESNMRFQELIGSTPANALLFGTPSKLLNGAKTEDEFFELLESGYARRSFFAFTPKTSGSQDLTPEELYNSLCNTNQEQLLTSMRNKVAKLADINLVGMELKVPKNVGIELVRYRQWCEARAEELPSFMEVQKAELAHRYFKTLKLAGAYAFLDLSADIQIKHLHQAIKFAEESGLAIERMFHREKPYERLAKYIAENQGKELTQVDLANDLPFYKGSQSTKNDMINMAIAYGYKNNIILKKTFKDGIEFFSGESLEETNLNKMIIAYSEFMGEGYINDEIKFENLHKLILTEGYNWTTHHSIDGCRNNSSMSSKSNLLVLDVDSSTSIMLAKQVFKNYKYLIHTTKRHQKTNPETGESYGDRFRIILPTNYILNLDAEEFKIMMEEIEEWLPIKGIDTQVFQPSRSWACNKDAQYEYNDGELFDVLPFIPKTKRNEEHKQVQTNLANLDRIERWFAQKMVEGNRNNMLANFGFMLMDMGLPLHEVENRILDFNNKLSNKLKKSEVENTVISSVKNRFAKKE